MAKITQLYSSQYEKVKTTFVFYLISTNDCTLDSVVERQTLNQWKKRFNLSFRWKKV